MNGLNNLKRNSMEKHFVTFEQALALKDLGFDEPCFGFYSVLYDLMITQTNGKKSLFELECLAPLKSQVFEWSRDEYGLYHIVHHFEHNKNTANEFLSEVTGKLLMGNDDISGFSYHSTYKEAELACINNLIEIVKSKKQ
jgi:hypothetical protein